MAVLCFDSEGPYHAVAERVSEDRDEPIVDAVSDLPDEQVVYVTPIEDIDESVVLSLQQRLAELGPDSGGFGIVTGHTPDAAVALYERGAALGSDTVDDSDRSEHSIYLRESTTDWFSYDDETTVLTGSNVTVDRVRSQLDDLDSLSMMIHGRSMHYFLEDGYLCGFPIDRSASFDGPQPYCVSDGKLSCPLEGELLHADEFEVPHIFVDSCASTFPGNDYEGLPVHVGTGLLTGATSLIGTYRQIDSLEQCSLLHYCLVRGGYSTAERCYLLNRLAHCYNTSAFPYVPFGCPETVSATSDPGGVETAVDGSTVTLTGIDTPIIDVSLDGSWEDDQYYVRAHTDAVSDAPIFGGAFREDDHLRLLVYSWGRLELDELELEVGRDPVGAEDRTIVTAALENADRLATLNYLDNKANGQRKDLANRFDGLADDIHKQRYDLNAHRKLRHKTSRILEGVERIEDRLLDQLEDRYSNYLADDYRDEFRETDVRVSTMACRSCDRQLFEKTMADTTGTTRRTRGICPECGVVFDLPAEADAEAAPRIDGDIVGVTDDRITVELSFQNPKEIPLRAVFYPWLGVDNDAYRGASIFDPESVRTTLEPGERETISFDVAVDEVEPNEYYLCGYVIGNLDIYQASRRMIVGSEYGHLRSDRRAAELPAND